MTVKTYYDKHLGNFYSWMAGDFELAKNDFIAFCKQYDLCPSKSKTVIDLGAGNGIQSVALAELGFKVKAIDFNQQLLSELRGRKKGLDIEIIEDDLRSVATYETYSPELIVCCGDTISHLDIIAEIKQLLNDCYSMLNEEGKVLLTFRDYSVPLEDTNRFIPVKSDEKRILTCVLEYLQDKIRVTDLLYEQQDGQWRQKVSSYYKLRISREQILAYLEDAGFIVKTDATLGRMVALVGQKM